MMLQKIRSLLQKHVPDSKKKKKKKKKAQSCKRKYVCPIFLQVELFLIQVNGLTDGYNNNPGVIDTDIDVFGLL